MTNLVTELSSSEYDGKSFDEILNILKNKKVAVVGKIAYGNTLHLVSMLARGLRTRIDTCVIPSLKAAWYEALQPAYLASPAYSINVALPEIRQMLDAGVTYGVCTQAEHDFIVQLATYDQYPFAETTIKDIVAVKQPSLLSDNTVTEIGEVLSGLLKLELNTLLPDTDSISVEAAYSKDGLSWTNYSRVNSFRDVKDSGIYFCDLPMKAGLRIKVRWKPTTYKVQGTVTAV